jgi:hypothetical protein
MLDVWLQAFKITYNLQLTTISLPTHKLVINQITKAVNNQ